MKTEVYSWRVSADLKTALEQETRGCERSMTANALIDTGAILALLDRSDRWHRLCVDAFAQLPLPLATSEAVLAELLHLVGDSRHEMEAGWQLVRSGAIVLAPIEDSELASTRALMSRYADRPMDFRGCNSRASGETEGSVHHLHGRSRGLQYLPDRRSATVSCASGRPANESESELVMRNQC
jgi:uncharacterized protein